MTYKDIKHNEEVNELLKKGNQNLGLLGYTDHSQAHCVRVAETAAQILKKFGYSEHDIELARIAGYMLPTAFVPSFTFAIVTCLLYTSDAADEL